MNNIMKLIKDKLKGSTTMPGMAAKHDHSHTHMHGGACCGHDHGDHSHHAHDHSHDDDENCTTPGKGGGCCG